MVECTRCGAKLLGRRHPRVEYTDMSGLTRSGLLCSDCMGGLRAFMKGREV